MVLKMKIVSFLKWKFGQEHGVETKLADKLKIYSQCTTDDLKDNCGFDIAIEFKYGNKYH